MGSVRFGQILFAAISGDHVGAKLPHLHAYVGSGEAVIELDGAAVRLSTAHGDPIRGYLKKNELRLIIREAIDNYEALLVLWRLSQP